MAGQEQRAERMLQSCLGLFNRATHYYDDRCCLLYNIPQVTTLAYSPLPASVEQEGPTRHVRDMHAAGTCTC
jgi:hypothetical protein